MPLAPLAGVLIALAGIILLASALRTATTGTAAVWLADELRGDSPLAYPDRVDRPVFARIGGAVSDRWGDLVRAAFPPARIEALTRTVEQAGLSGALRGEEILVSQVLLALSGCFLGIVWAGVAGLPFRTAFLAIVFLSVTGVLAPSVWLERRVTARRTAVRHDLPDVLDLLAISVEAGLGFEAALELAGRTMHSAVADELGITLHEMELGRSRREALHHLKQRVDVPELSALVAALQQADALGMPLGRVLHAQAGELRNKRRQWARERAAKLPVKILFPMVAFVFPAILVVVLGPAAISVAHALR